MTPKRIVILGNAGSGKSTFSRQLGQHLALPVIHLDRLFWGPGWTKSATRDFRARVSEAIHGPEWVCEGNYHRKTFDLRLAQADLVLWLDTPRLTCVKRVLIRSWRNEPRVDLPAGCLERLDKHFLEFLQYIWRFDKVSRPAIEAERMLQGPAVPVFHLNGPSDRRAFLTAIGPNLPDV